MFSFSLLFLLVPSTTMTMTTKKTCATIWALCLPCSHAFVISGPLRRPVWRKSLQSHGDDFANDDEGIFFDDFDFTVGNSGSDGPSDSPSPSGSLSVLQQRLSQLVATQEESMQHISENWKNGHWSVRGCSLDPGDKGFGESKVQVSSLFSALDDEGDETIIVGRTDGSLCWLSLGSEYLASFTNQYVAKETSNDTIAVTEELKRDEASSIPMPLPIEGVSNVDEASAALSDGTTSNFEILAQVQASDAAILDMAVVGDASSEYQVLYTLTQSPTDPVRQIQIQEDGPVCKESTSLPISDLASVPSPVRSIRALRGRFLLSISQNGLTSLWKPEQTTSSMISSFAIPLEDDDKVLSCDADEGYVYVGTFLGCVYVYSIDKILEDNNGVEPLKFFSAFANAGVSSICAAGEGVMGKGRPTPTLALVTGSTLGEIKQWELLPRDGIESLEYWPKLSSQKLPGKAHILIKGQLQSFAESTAESAILDLRPVQEGVILSATKDKLTIWNTATGESFCDMQGLDFEQGASCLVLSDHLLVTNGLQQFICVHDFSIDPDLATEDMIVPMDDE